MARSNKLRTAYSGDLDGFAGTITYPVTEINTKTTIYVLVSGDFLAPKGVFERGRKFLLYIYLYWFIMNIMEVLNV